MGSAKVAWWKVMTEIQSLSVFSFFFFAMVILGKMKKKKKKNMKLTSGHIGELEYCHQCYSIVHGQVGVQLCRPHTQRGSM